jgi:putative tryptophan/tyrosine transport system substrate-binding protein
MEYAVWVGVLLHYLAVPQALFSFWAKRSPAFLKNESWVYSSRSTAQSIGLQLRMLNAGTLGELNAAFAALVKHRPDAILIGGDPFFVIRRQEIVAQVARTGLPAVYPFREFTEAGGLISYGTNLVNAFRQIGIYAGRILKGAKPTDLPVMQPTTFELVINLRAAKALGFDIPPTLHARSRTMTLSSANPRLHLSSSRSNRSILPT